MEKPIELLKRSASSLLPEKILQQVRNFYSAHTLRAFSIDDEPDLKVVQHLVRPGGHVIDLGANDGVYTKFLSIWVGPQGRVFAVEPVPETFKVLCHNVRALHLENVVPLNFAVSDQDCTLSMEIPLYRSGRENYHLARVVKEPGRGGLRRTLATGRRLDSILGDSTEAISFIKCDVEGHEAACVRGAVNTIHKYYPSWLIEVGGDPSDPSSSGYQTFSFLADEGYDPYWFDGKTLRRWEQGAPAINYFFLTLRHVEKLSACAQGISLWG